MEAVSSIQTKDQIAAQLRTLIFNGELVDGEEIVQETLAAMLGVSRMPVRESLQTLELEGLLERLPNRHMRIVRFQTKEIHQMFHVWSMIETEMAFLLIQEGENLEAIISAVNDCNDAEIRHNSAMSAEKECGVHLIIAQALESRFFARLQKSVLGGYLLYATQNHPEHAADRIRQLNDLVKALIDKKTQQATEAIHAYFALVADALSEDYRNE